MWMLADVTAGDWLLAVATVLAVLFGVFAEAWLSRRRARHAALEAAVSELAMVLPYVVSEMSEVWQGPRATKLGSEWSRRRDRVTELTVAIRRLSAGRSRRARSVATAIDDLTSRVIAAELRFLNKGQLVRRDELFELTTDGVTRAVFGEGRGPVDDLVTYYETHGPGAPAPHARSS